MGRELASEKLEISHMDDVSYSDAELVSHVRDALNSVTEGDDFHYEHLRKVIHHKNCLDADEVAILVATLKGLSGAVSYIDSVHHGALLDSIFQMKLWDYGPDVMHAIVDLIISLAAVNGKHIDSCLVMLVGNFTPPNYYLPTLAKPRGYERKSQVLHYVHTSLKRITELMPIAPMRLSNIIVQQMPSIFWAETLVGMYVENMLLLESGYIGELIGKLMLIAVVDKLVDFDVEIQVSPDDPSKGIFEMELEDVDEDMFDDCQQDNKLLGGFSSSKKVKFPEMLDSLLVLMFEHLRLCQDGGRLNKVFETLLGSFETTILGTYKSKFSQFVVFHACSLDPETCGTRFAYMLFDIFTDNDKPPIRRMGAIAYLASYLSRAKCLLLPFVAEMLQRLVNWCLEYCKYHEGDTNSVAHSVFYSGCQAMIYVLCFRMRSMMDRDHLETQLRNMNIDAILRHPLDPLKVCLPSIVEEFERQAKGADLFSVSNGGVFDYHLDLELVSAFGGTERLDMFFPFDPCLLKKSDRYIRPNFIFWSMVKPIYDDDDEDELEGNSEEEDEEFNDGRSTVVGDYSMAGSSEEHYLDKFEYSMNNMSITPKSSLSYQFEREKNGAMRMPSRIRPSTSPESL